MYIYNYIEMSLYMFLIMHFMRQESYIQTKYIISVCVLFVIKDTWEGYFEWFEKMRLCV